MSSEPEGKATQRVSSWPELVGSLQSLKEADQLATDMLRRVRDTMQFAEDRLRNLVARAASKAIQHQGDGELSEVSPKVIRAVAESVLVEDDDELRILWENLLANAMTGMSIDQYVLNIVEQLDSESARALWELGSVPWPSSGGLDHDSRDDLSKKYGHAVVRLESLGLLITVRMHYYDQLAIGHNLEDTEEPCVESLGQALKALYDALRSDHMRISDLGYLVCTMVSEPGETFPKMPEIP